MKKLLNAFSTPCDISVELRNPTHAKTILVSDPNDQFGAKDKEMKIFTREDPVIGKVILDPPKKVDHLGIKVELIGEIILYYESKEVLQFLLLTKEISSPGSLDPGKNTFDFEFNKVDLCYESYRGINVDLRYFIRVTVSLPSSLKSKFLHEEEFWVQNVGERPVREKGVIMEVGIEEVVMLQIKYERVNLDVNGVVYGKLNFGVVNTDIEIGEVSVVRKESIGTGTNQHTEQETLRRFEVIDSSPISGEVVPIRLYLASIEPWKMTPSCENVNNKFSVKYFLHLSLQDKSGRRYFKQHELTTWRSSV